MKGGEMLVLEGNNRRGDSQYISSWASGASSLFKVCLYGVSPEAGALNIFRMSFRNVGSSQAYGIALLEIRNIPLEQ